KACLMESNDYHSRQDSKSFIGFEPIVELKLEGYKLTEIINGKKSIIEFSKEEPISEQVQARLNSFQFSDEFGAQSGFFGRIGFEFSLMNESHIDKKPSQLGIPDLHLFVYKYILIIDHFNDTGLMLKNDFIDQPINDKEINAILIKRPFASFPFETTGKEKSDFTDEEFTELVSQSKRHLERGDVFQLVLSNRYQTSFFGDDFEVYRSLRRLNPSPYLFYFDFEDYHLFGSSPEAQLKIENGEAEIHPIAGTMVKTGDPAVDEANIQFLINDEKENAEHTMLVDLARNDLSRSCSDVKVDSYKEIQAFSHVYHIVSIVKAQLIDRFKSFTTFSQTFPAGTLSGTPKPKALELISKYEKTTRDFYGGSVGMLAANGDVNMAIVIRSILSKDGKLVYRAGAGVVLDSQPDKECQEVHNKLRAVRVAIEEAQKGIQKPKLALL
ncbi:MAG: anthranilate synthase component 1, partial [Lentimonas sp.]